MTINQPLRDQTLPRQDPHAVLLLLTERVQLKVGLEVLLARFPNLYLAVEEGELVWDDAVAPKAPVALPVGW